MKTMQYKAYHARIDYDDEDKIFVGHIAGIRAIVGFHGTSVAELESAFAEAVDDYLAACSLLCIKARPAKKACLPSFWEPEHLPWPFIWQSEA